MIIDVTGIELIPGEKGIHCPGNGTHKNSQGELLPCCCEECAYFLCCSEDHPKMECKTYQDKDCPRARGNRGGERLPRD